MEDLKNNLGFVAVCLAIFVALVLIAKAAQKYIDRDEKKFTLAKRVAYIGMFSALAGVLMLIEIPLFFAPSFYKVDLSEIPVMMCTFAMGPSAGVVCELLKVTVKLLLKGTTTAFVGDFANFAIGCSMVLPASVVYHTRNTKKSAITGLVVGGAVMTVFGSFFNAVYLLPKFAELYGIPLESIIQMGTAVNAKITSVSTLVLFAVVPFNIIKAIIVSVVTMLLYKRVAKVLKLEK